MKIYAFILLLAALTSLLPTSAPEAAFKSSQDPGDPKAAFNPQPDRQDITLPMPCGLSMVLRPVNIPSGSLLQDRPLAMGIGNLDDSDRKLYESRFTAHLASPFTRETLPKEWAAHLASAGGGDSWAFIGKYEVSRLQWDSVLNALDDEGTEDAARCPRPGKDMAHPVTGISWFDVQEFFKRYNAWLIKNHPQALPSFAGTRNIGYLRLPTEEEWEFAARGGGLVPQEWWEDKDFFPLAEGKQIRDYGVFNSGTALSAPAPIGSRNPNPLGIYDTAGNVREMVEGLFRLSVADMRQGQVERRLHGAAGGLVAKGGGFRSSENEVLPGARDEAPLHTSQGLAKAPDLGFRVGLAGLNLPSSERLQTLHKEEQQLASQPARNAAPLNPQQSPSEIVASLAAEAEGVMKQNLAQLQSILEDREQAQARADARNLEKSFRSLLYQAETLRAFAFRYSATHQTLERIEALGKQVRDPAEKSRVDKALAQAKSDLQDYLHSIEMGANYYRTNLAALLDESRQTVDQLAGQAKEEYGAEGIFNAHMRTNIDTLEKYLNTARQKGLSALDSTAILQGILPPEHFRALPAKR